MSANDDKRPAAAGKETVRETPAAKAAGRGAAGAYTIPAGHAWSKLWMVWGGVAAAGAVISVLGFTADPKRFAYAYLAAFMWGLTLCLGALFFVLLQHLTGAGWSVVVRRGAEQLMGALPLFAVLVLPILFVFRETLYPWAGHAAHEPLIQAKSGYLNVPFWLIRAAVYFAIWIYFSFQLFSLSRRQDETGDPKLTLRAQGLSAPGMLLFALSITFAGIDWLMSLEPEWFSTMWGVYMFAGAVISIMAFLNLLFTRMQAVGLLAKEVTSHHFHDLGKLLFAFTVFWAYIAFSQYFLIWYANIPEETDFFHHRQQGGWGWVGIALVFGHFFGPFFLLLSRHAKRFALTRQIGAVVILLMHFVDMYWVVMPNVDHHLHPALSDAGPLLLVAGATLALTFRRMLAAPVMPVRDPRLDRSLEFENALGTAMAHETSEPKNLLILGIGVGSIVTLVAVLYGLQSYYYGMRDFEQHEKVLGRPNPDLVALRTTEERRLTTYAKLDPDGKQVRIPVDKAIGLLAQRGRDGFPAIRPAASALAAGSSPPPVGSAPSPAASAAQRAAPGPSAAAPGASGARPAPGGSAPRPAPGGAPPAPTNNRPPAPGGGR